MSEPHHVHICPRCGRAWELQLFMHLPDLGAKRVFYRDEQNDVQVKYLRVRRCTCGQELQQAEKIGA